MSNVPHWIDWHFEREAKFQEYREAQNSPNFIESYVEERADGSVVAWSCIQNKWLILRSANKQQEKLTDTVSD